MNIAKKLLFALLLCGATFAVACEDEGGDNGAFTGAGTAGQNATCKKTPTKADEKCKADYACVADSAGATSGKCATKCNAVADNDATCASKDTTKSACAEKDGVDGKVKVCVAGTTGGDKVKLGKDCSSKACESGLECVQVPQYGNICALSCTVGNDDPCAVEANAGPGNTKCQEILKKGSDTDKAAVCGPNTAPPPAKAKVTEDCSTKECESGLECVKVGTDNKCALSCTVGNDDPCAVEANAGANNTKCQEILKKGSDTDKAAVCGTP